MQISLSDGSLARLDRSTLRFYALDSPPILHCMPEMPEWTAVPFGIDCHKFTQNLQYPRQEFKNCFKRRNDTPSYYLRPTENDIDINYLPSVYRFPGRYSGVMFSDAYLDWNFLDGGITKFMAYGFGRKSYIEVRGAEALRLVCMFHGVFQPRTIKGETERRPLAVLLEEATRFPLTDRTKIPNLPNF